MFFPTGAYLLPSMLLRVPFSALATLCWTVITYPSVGAAPGFAR